MLEQTHISEQFQALLNLEQQAQRLYEQLHAKVGDRIVAAQLDQLRRDKQRHIQLIQRLLEIVEE